jgi:hypothetical protein
LYRAGTHRSLPPRDSIAQPFSSLRNDLVDELLDLGHKRTERLIPLVFMLEFDVDKRIRHTVDVDEDADPRGAAVAEGVVAGDLDIARLRLSAVGSLPLGDKEADVLCGVLLVCGWRETGMSISRTAEDLDLDELHQRQVGDEGRGERERVLLKRVHALGVTDIGCTKGGWCYSASSERKLLLYKLMCIVLCCFRDSLI